jgi:hypothetical protein
VQQVWCLPSCWSRAACCGVELGHELAVGCPGGGEFVVAFAELEAQPGGLLFELGDLVVQRVGVGGRAEAGLLPGLLAERLGEAFFELPDACVEAGGALVRGEQVGLQRRAGDGGAGGFACGGRACFQDVDLFEQVAVPVEGTCGRRRPCGRCRRR